MKRLLSVAVPLVLLAGLVAAAGADEPAVMLDSNGKRVKAGEYRDLNLWRKFKLWTAPAVNPDSVKHTAVAYVYDSHVVLSTLDDDTILDLLKNGAISMGKFEDDSYYVEPSKLNADWENALDLIKSGDKKIVFVSPEKDLVKSYDANPIVSWHAIDSADDHYQTDKESNTENGQKNSLR